MGNLETTGYYALGIPVIFVVILVELSIARRSFGFAETLSNLSAGLGTLVIGLFVGPWVFALYEYAHGQGALVDWQGSWIRWPAALLLADLCYYLHHRAGHRLAFLWTIHGVHHQHERLNSTVGLRLEWFADISTLFFFAPLPLLGIDSACGFLTVAGLSLYTLTTHAPALGLPGFGVLVTAASHGAHHSRDARYSGFNFGAMFTFWDRLFGTYRPHDPAEPLRSDMPTICRMHDGVSAQWSLMAELLDDLRRAPTWGSALRLLVGRPGLNPGDLVPAPRDDAALALPARAYLLADFVATVAFATWLLWLRDKNPFLVRLVAAGLVIWSLRAIGGLLDGRPGSVLEAGLRWLAALLLATALAPQAPIMAALLAGGAAMGLAVLVSLRDGLRCNDLSEPGWT